MIHKLIHANNIVLIPKIDNKVESVSTDLLAKKLRLKGNPSIKPQIQIRNNPTSFLVYFVGLVPKYTS